MSGKAVFAELTDAECRELLARHHVGRIAYQMREYINIAPIGYVYHGEWLACRTQEGTKVSVLRHSPYVAFEVDEVEGPFDWKSVVIQGSYYEEDPTPFRDVLFRIHIRELTGRSATTKS
jgi:nitroimidazol reductase NimA-like FMN-containing flavoprotein (pyridoxamine 5'-phosphate oxidase superfamily)